MNSANSALDDSINDISSSCILSPEVQSEMDALLLGRIKELSTVDVKTSNWKGTLISILVILFLSSVIILAIYIINPDIQYKLKGESREKLKLSELLDGNYTIRSTFNGSWLNDHQIVYMRNLYETKKSTGDFVLYDILHNNITTIIYSHILSQYEVDRAILSPNRKYVLFVSNTKNVFRHSTLARYTIYNLQTEKTIDVKPENIGENHETYLQAAEWGPKDAQLIFIYKNNLYYMSEPDRKYIKQITFDNDNRWIFNGIPDWIYEEEILATGTAFWWSKDGNFLSYAQFNDTDVDLQEYPWYGDDVDIHSQYLDSVRIKYPKPGSINPTVKLFVVNLNENSNDPSYMEPIEVLPPDGILSKKDYYLTSVSWSTNDGLLAMWMNRVQNYSSFSLCQPNPLNNNRQWKCKDNFVGTMPNGWIEITDILVDPDLKYFYILYPNDETPQKYVQILRIGIKISEQKFITNLSNDVTKIMKILKNPNGQGNIVYYMATRSDRPGERHAYSIVDDLTSTSATKLSTKQQQKPKCYTCDLIKSNQCLYNRVVFSENASYFLHECLGPNIPYSTLKKSIENDSYKTNNLITIDNNRKNSTKNSISDVKDNNNINSIDDEYDIDGGFVQIKWESNELLSKTLEKKLMPTIKTELIKRPGNDPDIIVQMFMPPSFNPDGVAKYPLLVQVYAGPGSQNVNENFKINFGKYLASNKEIIYAYIDGRGSGFQGETMKYKLYHKLGTIEIEDQIYAAKYLRDQYNYINKDAIGIWGWSYGGYATAQVLAKDRGNDPVFACGISVAPVTSWLIYDSAYTERYMGIPEADNETLRNYLDSDLMHLAGDFKGKKFLLIHGTADDNVHIQNSMVLIKELNKKNILFNTQIYPDENHGLHGVSTHLYNTMEAFWNNCFQLEFYVEEIGLRRKRLLKYGQMDN